MTELKTSLREIRKACDLGPLRGENLNRFWINTDSARDPLRRVRDNLRQLLEDRDDTKILFYGHGGSGKSTELNKLVQELGDEYLVVSFSAREEMNLIDVNSEDIILVLIERLVATAERNHLSIDAKALQGVNDYFATFTETRHEEDAKTAKLGAGIKAASPSLLDLFKLFAEFKAEVRYEAKNEKSRVAAIRKRPGNLIDHANLLINAVRANLPDNQKLLFIVEDLDKLDIATARQVFIEKHNILTSLNASIIYTIPIFTFHSPDAPILQAQFRFNLSLPMIKVIEPKGKIKAQGFDIVRQIIISRLGKNALTPEAMNLLIEKTGGVLQHAFKVIMDATLLHNATVPLGAEQIRHSLDRKKSQFLTEITLPFEPVQGLERREQLYERLRDCLQDQQAGTPCKLSGEPLDQVLLKSCALVEYNGQGWLGVHPLVQEILHETSGM
jgi:hypothetical protein